MTARKLSDSEKQQILDLYRQTGETSSTLASRYGVSTSTVSRILKSNLPADEYEVLIQQKRLASVRGSDEPLALETVPPSRASANPVVASQLSLESIVLPVESLPEPAAAESAVAEPVDFSRKPIPAIRRRSRPSSADADSEPLEPTVSDRSFGKSKIAAEKADDEASSSVLNRAKPNIPLNPTEAEALESLLDEELLDQDLDPDEDLSDLDDEDALDDLDDEDDDEGDDDEGDASFSNSSLLVSGKLRDGALVRILPLADAPIPRICYLVVDRAAELIARPLKEFGDLGQIPEEETQQRTLPIFDNHRVAKRYSNPRTQRVIKLPEGRILQKTSSHLRAKGITRLLIDGRVYSLKE